MKLLDANFEITRPIGISISSRLNRHPRGTPVRIIYLRDHAHFPFEIWYLSALNSYSHFVNL